MLVKNGDYKTNLVRKILNQIDIKYLSIIYNKIFIARRKRS